MNPRPGPPPTDATRAQGSRSGKADMCTCTLPSPRILKLSVTVPGAIANPPDSFSVPENHSRNPVAIVSLLSLALSIASAHRLPLHPHQPARSGRNRNPAEPHLFAHLEIRPVSAAIKRMR